MKVRFLLGLNALSRIDVIGFQVEHVEIFIAARKLGGGGDVSRKAAAYDAHKDLPYHSVNSTHFTIAIALLPSDRPYS